MEIKSEISPAAPVPIKGYGSSPEAGPDILSLLRQVISPDILSVSLESIKKGGVIAKVFKVHAALRLDADLHPGADRHPHVVVKIIHPDAKGGHYARDREVNFYSAVFPLLNIQRPKVYFSGCDLLTHYRIVIMEDLDGYRIPERTYRWTQAEAECFVRAYARLHLPIRDLSNRAEPWFFNIRASEFSAGEVQLLVDDLVRAGVWKPIQGLGVLVEWVRAAAESVERSPRSYLHGDVFPPNISLPQDLANEAVLIDFDMIGIGPAEMDLAFMFLQPFESAADLNREAVLEAYWRERLRLEGSVPPVEERRLRQKFADALWGLYLIKIAHNSVFEPFVEGTSPDVYWTAMRTVLHRWLSSLTAE